MSIYELWLIIYEWELMTSSIVCYCFTTESPQMQSVAKIMDIFSTQSNGHWSKSSRLFLIDLFFKLTQNNGRWSKSSRHFSNCLLDRSKKGRNNGHLSKKTGQKMPVILASDCNYKIWVITHDITNSLWWFYGRNSANK